MNTGTIKASEVVKMLGMARHPEGGWFVETFRDAAGSNGRSFGTAIYYLLEAGDRSHWHRVDAAEIWHFYAGAALALSISGGKSAEHHVLGSALGASERPQVIVPAGAWQSAESTGAWTLVGCTVAPGFEFSGFEMAPPGWQPGDAGS